MKRFLFIIVSFVLLISVFCLPVFAANYSAYSSVTSGTSNISMLIETMFNQPDFSPFKDWIGIRTGQYDYSVFYNIDNGFARRIRYYGVQSGYSTEWYLVISDEANFSYSKNGYTIVGSTSDSLGAASFRTYFADYILYISVPAILVVLLFFVFRFRKNKRGISL